MDDLTSDFVNRRNQAQEQDIEQSVNSMLKANGFDEQGNVVAAPPSQKSIAQPPIPTTTAGKAASGLVTAFRESASGLVTGYRESASGFYDLLANVPYILDRAADKISAWTGMPKGGAFTVLEGVLRQAAKDVAPTPVDLQDKNSFTDYLYRAIGAAPVTVSEYAAGGAALRSSVAGMALIDAVRVAPQGIVQSALEGLKGAAMGKGLELVAPFSRPTRAAIVGTGFGAIAAASGASTQESLAQTVVGAGLGAIGSAKEKGKIKPTPEEIAATEEKPPETAIPAGLARKGEAALSEEALAKQAGRAEDRPTFSGAQAAERFFAEEAAKLEEVSKTPEGKTALRDRIGSELTPDIKAELAAEGKVKLTETELTPELKDTFEKIDSEIRSGLELTPQDLPTLAARVNGTANILAIDPQEVLSTAKAVGEIKKSPEVERAIERTTSLLEAAAKTVFPGPPTSQQRTSSLLQSAQQILTGQSGQARPEILFALTRALAGAVYGASQGDTLEDRIGNALLYGMGFAAVSPKMVKGIISTMRRIDPQGIRKAELEDRGMTRTIDQAVKINKDTTAKLQEFLKLNEADLKIEGRVQGFNYDHINTPEDVKYTVAKIAKVYEKEIGKARKIDPVTGEGVPHEETMAAAKALGMTEDRVFQWPDGQPMTRPELQATRVVAVDSANNLKDLSNRYLAEPTDMNLRRFLDRFAKQAQIAKVLQSQVSEAARTLESMKIDVAGDELRFTYATNNVVTSIEKSNWSPQELARRVAALEEPGAVNQFLRQTTKPGVVDALLELWYNAWLLGNPKTLGVNAIGSGLAMGWQLPKRMIAAGLTEILGEHGNPEFVQWSEPMGMLYGIREGYQDAWKMAGNTFRTGTQLSRGAKFEVPRQAAFRAETFGLEGGKLALAIDYLGTGIRTVSRTMAATDEWFYTLGIKMELASRIARQASAESADTISLAKQIRERLVENDFTAADKEAAKRFSIYNTFNSKPGPFIGGVIGAIDALKQDHPVGYLLAKRIVPFITIPTNITKWTIREGPLGFLTKDVRSALAKGGADAELAWAGITLGSIVMTIGAYLASEGILQSGHLGDPQETKMRKASGEAAYSINLPDGHVFPIDRYDPIAMPLAWASDFVHVSGYLSDDDLMGSAMMFGIALMRPLANKTYLQGTAQFLDAIVSKDAEALSSYAKQQGGTLVPSLVRAVRYSIDPYMRQADSTWQSTLANTPFLSKNLPPVTDAFARPIRNVAGADDMWVAAFGVVNPVAYSKREENAVIDEILRQRFKVTSVSDTIYGHRDNPFDERPPDAGVGLKLEGWDYAFYKKLFGDKALELLDKLFQSENYKKATPGPDGGKNILFQNVMNVSREWARQKLLGESPEIKAKVETKLEERKRAIIGQGIEIGP